MCSFSTLMLPLCFLAYIVSIRKSAVPFIFVLLYIISTPPHLYPVTFKIFSLSLILSSWLCNLLSFFLSFSLYFSFPFSLPSFLLSPSFLSLSLPPSLPSFLLLIGHLRSIGLCQASNSCCLPPEAAVPGYLPAAWFAGSRLTMKDTNHTGTGWNNTSLI